MNVSFDLTAEGMSFLKDDNEGAKNDYSDRRNKFSKETEEQEVMCVIRHQNKEFSTNDKNLDSSTAVVKSHQNNSRKNSFFSFIASFTSLFCKKDEILVSDDQDPEVKGNDLQNSKLGSNLETIENWLDQFGKTFILSRLEESLEQVKKNQISKESHKKLSKSIDRELLKLLIAFHYEWQSENIIIYLKAIREVLKTVTEVFLENIFIDYKYEYFFRLDVSVLVNENKRKNTIETILFKIRVFSQAKRINTIREIRKFLIESEKCVVSFLEHNESDFLKFRGFALYHLKKNIEGYKLLERECNILIKECSNEDDSIRTVVHSMVDQSLREWAILRELEQVAKRSFQGNFEIFPLHEDMNEYYILPFVDYVNVLSMCTLLLQPPKFRFFMSLSKVEFLDDRNLFIEAYILAYVIYQLKGKVYFKARRTVLIHEYSQELRKTLKAILSEILQIEYRVDVYKESNDNSTEILDLKHFLENIEEKGKTFIEHLNQYKSEKKETSESVVNYRQDKELSFEVGTAEDREIEDLKKINLLPEREESKFKMERNVFPESIVNYTQDEGANSKVDMKNGEKESETNSMTLYLRLVGEENQCKTEANKFGESVLNCRQNEEESFKVNMIEGEKEKEDLEGEENQNKIKTKKCCKSVLNCKQDDEENFKVNMTKREKETEGSSGDLNSHSEGEKIPE